MIGWLRRIWWSIRHAIGGCHMRRCRMVQFKLGNYLQCQDCLQRWDWYDEPETKDEQP